MSGAPAAAAAIDAGDSEGWRERVADATRAATRERPFSSPIGSPGFAVGMRDTTGSPFAASGLNLLDLTDLRAAT